VDGPAAAVGDLKPVQVWQRLVEGGQLGAQLPPEAVDESGGVEGLVQHLVVLGPVGLEVGGQVLVRVPPLVGADDPDLLAAQPVP
jgi:hypothetical protein